MSDHKFERDEDREVTPSEIKNRLIVLMENGFEMPSVHIYDEPVRYLKMNLEWFKIFAGWLSWMEHPGFWRDAEDYDFEAIEQVLLFEEGIESVPEPSELESAIHSAMYRVFNDVAKQIVSGRTTNINVDDTGTVSDPTEGIGEEDAPEDDPGTPDIDESKASQYAGYLSIALGVNDVLAYLHTLYGNDATEDTSAADAKLLVASRWATIASIMEPAIDAYWVDRAASKAQIQTADREDLANYLYCNRFGDNVAETVKTFFANLSGPTNEAKLNAVGIVDGLGDEQYSIWYNQGAATRTTEYKSAPCEPIADYQFTLQFNTVFNDTQILKAYHRYEVTVTGYGVDPADGDWQDAFWHKQTGQNPVFDAADFNIQIGQAVKIKPDVFEAPINATTHSYKWSIDMGPINAGAQWTMNRDATMSVSTTSPSNGFLVTVKDLGQYR